jgi:hypothetical protein
VENGTGATAGSTAVQERFGTAFGLPIHYRMAMLIHHDEICAPQVAFVLSARRDDQSQWIPFDHNAVVARCSQGPTTRPKLISDPAETIDWFREMR